MPATNLTEARGGHLMHLPGAHFFAKDELDQNEGRQATTGVCQRVALDAWVTSAMGGGSEAYSSLPEPSSPAPRL